ncbi:MAG TPA: ATP-binding protein [Acidimicrobiales bacterium]|nr:ATP-binding protein [Acidimicrobiales bacterium]
MSGRFEVTPGVVGELFWRVPDPVVVVENDAVLAWNPAAEEILGMPASAAIAPGADLRPAFGDALDAFWALARTGGEAQLHCVTGSDRELQGQAWPMEGHPGRMLVVLHDVTVERRHLLGLARLNSLARELLRQPAIDVLLQRLVDEAKELTGAAFTALLVLRDGSDREVQHFVYNAPRELFPERLPRVVGLLAVPIESRSLARIDDIRGHPAGVGIPVQHPPIAALLAVPVCVGDVVVGELAVANQPGQRPFDEVDEAMLLELASHAALAVSLAQARAAREHADRARQDMLDLALHNLRTPLTVARGFVDTLQSRGDDLAPDERDRAFEAVHRAHERIQELTEGALLADPFRNAPAQSQAVLTVVDDLVGELCRDYGTSADITVECRVEPGSPSTIDVDRRVARELLDNLVSNAVKHAPVGSVVTITVRPEGDGVRIDVTDRGPGISAEDHSRVFERFYRTAPSRQAGIPGSGAGLWIARRLAEDHGVAIGLASRLGHGTTFWATFPSSGGAAAG